MAILGAELAAELVKMGFELLETKVGEHITVYYFRDCEELEIHLKNYFENF